MLADYRALELSCEAAIFKKYNLQFPMPSCIKEADNRMFVSERLDLQPNVPIDEMYADVKRVPWTIVPWSARKAEEQFLKRYFELGGEDK